MSKDALMSKNDEIESTGLENARNQMQQFSLLAKGAHGQAILELIKQVLEAPGMYVFAELLEMPNIQELKTGDNVKFYNTLQLFAYGTYKDYRQKPEEYLELTPIMLKKLQQLTIVSVAIKTKCIKYDLLMEELEISVVRQLEDIIIEAIYADIIRGKLFQNERLLEIEYAQGRDVPPDYLSKIEKILQDWVNSCDKTYTCIENQVETANYEKAKRLQNKNRIEKEIAIMKKTLKTQVVDHDEPMNIDAHDSSSTSTSQEPRRKPGRPKSTRSGSMKFAK